MADMVLNRHILSHNLGIPKGGARVGRRRGGESTWSMAMFYPLMESLGRSLVMV